MKKSFLILASIPVILIVVVIWHDSSVRKPFYDSFSGKITHIYPAENLIRFAADEKSMSKAQSIKDDIGSKLWFDIRGPGRYTVSEFNIDLADTAFQIDTFHVGDTVQVYGLVNIDNTNIAPKEIKFVIE